MHIHYAVFQFSSQHTLYYCRHEINFETFHILLYFCLFYLLWSLVAKMPLETCYIIKTFSDTKLLQNVAIVGA